MLLLTQTAVAPMITAAAHGGAACPALTKTQPCNTQACPIDCVVSAFVEGVCDKACGGGSLTSTRTVVTPAAFGGAACPALTQIERCNAQDCPRMWTYLRIYPGITWLLLRLLFVLGLFG